MARKKHTSRPARDPRTGRFRRKPSRPKRSRRKPDYGSPYATLEQIEADLTGFLDSLDMWHKPGDGSSLDTAVKALWQARRAVASAVEDHEPYNY